MEFRVTKPPPPASVDLGIQNSWIAEDWASLTAQLQIRLADTNISKDQKALAHHLYAAGMHKLASSLWYWFYPVEIMLDIMREGEYIPTEESLAIIQWGVQDVLQHQGWVETVGQLSVNMAKRSLNEPTFNLEFSNRRLINCLQHRDFVNFQKIVSMIQIRFAKELQRPTRTGEKRNVYLFWNIAALSMLKESMVKSENEKALSDLCLMYAKKVADPAPGPNTIKSEEELLLFFRVASDQASTDGVRRLLMHKKFHPNHLYDAGHQSSWKRSMEIGPYSAEEKFTVDYKIMAEISKNPDRCPLDYKTWQDMIKWACSQGGIYHGADMVASLTGFHSTNPRLSLLHKRNALLARVEAAVQALPVFSLDYVEGRGPSDRLAQIMYYVSGYGMLPACFDDMKRLADRLDSTGLKHLAYVAVPQRALEGSSSLSGGLFGTLACKFQYLAATCPQTMSPVPSSRKSLRKCGEDGFDPHWRCQICDKVSDKRPCANCLRVIAGNAVGLHKALLRAEPGLERGRSVDQAKAGMADLALVVALCLIRMQVSDSEVAGAYPRPPTDTLSIIQAICVLERQLQLTPKHGPILLVLSRLHMMVGCGHRAWETWQMLEVKRVTIESIGPLFFDRLSTICPALLLAPHSPLVDAGKHYTSCFLDETVPDMIWEALVHNNYNSACEIARWWNDRRTSLGRTMMAVEESRARRATGYKMLMTRSWDPRLVNVHSVTHIPSYVDRASFPQWESQNAKLVWDIIGLSPFPTGDRMNLSRLTEHYFDLMSWKAPVGYKPTVEASTRDTTNLLESLARLSDDMMRAMPAGSDASSSSELVLFEIIQLLSAILTISISPPDLQQLRIDRQALREIHDEHVERLKRLDECVESVVTGLEFMVELTTPTPAHQNNITQTLETLSSLPAITCLRDAATAARMAAVYIAAHCQREADRTNTPPTEKIMAHTRTLRTAANAAADKGKGQVADATAKIKAKEFTGRLREWVETSANDDATAAVVAGFGADISASTQKLVEGWRDQMADWRAVKWS